MTAVDDALARLKRAIQKSKSKCMKDQANTLSQITSYLVFLVGQYLMEIAHR